MSSRKKSSPFAIDKDGKDLFIKVKHAGMHPLCLLIDGIAMSFFGKGRTAYLRVSQAIEWHKKELADSNGRSGSREIVEILEGALEKFKAEKLTET